MNPNAKNKVINQQTKQKKKIKDMEQQVLKKRKIAKGGLNPDGTLLLPSIDLFLNNFTINASHS
jgi:hypothetical protein